MDCLLSKFQNFIIPSHIQEPHEEKELKTKSGLTKIKNKTLQFTQRLTLGSVRK